MPTYEGSSGNDVLSGSAGADLMSGLAGDDSLSGLAGHDTLDGGAGADTLTGGAGRDVFTGGFGPGDFIEGGDGIDRVVGLDLSWATSAVRVDFDAQLNLLYTDGSGPQLWIGGCERFDGLSTGAGDDVLRLGFAGASFTTVFSGGAGRDLIELDYAGGDGLGRSATGVTLSAPAGGYALLTVALSDGSSLAPLQIDRDIEFYDVTGSTGSDMLRSGGGDDTLRGSGGADTLAGGAGADSLSGGIGADRLAGSLGDDLLDGGAGADALYGGSGLDLASYRWSGAGVVVDLGQHAGTAGAAAGDALWEIEGVVGSLHDDRLVGDAGHNRLYGAYGADTLLGLGGDDHIDAGSGPVFVGSFVLARERSHLDGGDGNDTIWGATQVASSADPTYYQPAEIDGGRGDDDLYNGLVVRAGEGNDYVYGGAIDSTIDGGSGDDEVEATYGNHTVTGGEGSDYVWTETLHGGTNVVDLGAGDDVGAVWSYDPLFAHRFDGGAGIDGFVLSMGEAMVSLTAPVQIDLLDQLNGQIGSVAGLQLTNFERFSLLLGGEHDDVVRLGQSTDFVRAAEGDDYLLGRGGDDYLEGGYGVDAVVGGAGNDVVIAGSSPAGQVEAVRGGLGDDVVYGNFSSADYGGVARLYGDAGRDVFGFLPSGTYTPDRVMDFDVADDYIALYPGPYYAVDPTGHEFDAITPSRLTDTDAALSFTFTGRFGQVNFGDIDVHYDKGSGVLRVRDASTPGNDWIRVTTIAGAPDLGMAHFLTMPEAAGSTDAWFEGLFQAAGASADLFGA